MAAPLRVVQITNGIPEDQLGGLQRYVGELSTALADVGVEVVVLTRRRTDDAAPLERSAGRVIVRRAYTDRAHPLYAGVHPIRTFRSMLGFLRSVPPDVVLHGHFAVQAAPVLRLPHPFVTTFHSPGHKELQPEHQGGASGIPAPLLATASAVMERLERRLAQRADRVVTLSEFMRREALELAPDVADRIEVVPGGLDLDRFAPGTSLPDAWADAGRGPLLFTARRFVPRTGVLELIEALGQIRDRHPDVRLAVAGDGPQREQIVARIGALGLEGAVRLLGRVSDEELVSWDRRADLVVLPTRQMEGFGLSASEAMGCGTPVLGTPAGGLPEVTGKLGPQFVTAGTEVDDIAAGLDALLAQPRLLADAASRARGIAERDFGWASVVARYLPIYEEARRAAERRR